MFEFCRTNQSRAMWLTRVYHVIPHHSSLLLLMRAVDALLCQNKMMTLCYHDSHMMSRVLCPQESAQCVPDPFLACVVHGVWERDKVATQLIFFSLSLTFISYKLRFGLETGILQPKRLPLISQEHSIPSGDSIKILLCMQVS